MAFFWVHLTNSKNNIIMFISDMATWIWTKPNKLSSCIFALFHISRWSLCLNLKLLGFSRVSISQVLQCVHLCPFCHHCPYCYSSYLYWYFPYLLPVVQALHLSLLLAYALFSCSIQWGDGSYWSGLPYVPSSSWWFVRLLFW